MLYLFCVGMFGVASIPLLSDIVGLESEREVDLDLLRGVSGCKTYSVAFLLAEGHAPGLATSVVWLVFNL